MTVPSTGATRTAVRRSAVLAHLLVVLVGLAVLAYPFTIGATPDVSCRGTVMRPGDTCAKAGNAAAPQTYEQRAADARNARPVIVGGGLLVTAFGLVLLRGELRRRRPDEGPEPDRSA